MRFGRIDGIIILLKTKKGKETEQMKILLDADKPYFKANLHGHTTMSDGVYSPEEVKAHYKKNGYSVIAYTDHEHLIDNSHLNDEDFLAITSCEVAIKQFPEQSTLKNQRMKVTHLNFYALDPHNTVTPCYSSTADHFINDNCRHLVRFEGEYERVYSPEGINEMIRIAKEKGFIVSYNHPSWSLENAFDYVSYEGLWAVEIYNHGCVKGGIHDDEAVFDDILRTGKKIYCTACDDSHNFAPFGSPYNDSCGGWVCINADKLEYGEIMRALQNGDFYASSGPAIESLTQDGNTVTVRTSPCRYIHLITEGRRRRAAIAEEGKTITEATFELMENDGYFRIRTEDEHGKRAYTQAYEVS